FITLNAAKWGSGFATNGWLYFNQVATSGGATYLGNRDTLVALPQSPNITHYQAFISLASACNIHYSYTREQIVEAYIVRGTGGVADRRLLANTDFAAALAFSEGRDIHIKIGHFDPTFTEEKGMVKAFCGEMIIEAGISTEEPGFLALQAGYYDFARSMLLTRPAPGVCLATLPNFLQTRVIAHAYVGTYTSTGELRAGRLEELIEEYLSIHRERERAEASNYINSCLLVTQGILQGSPTWNIDPDGLNLGWAGAAIWYNKLAQMNGGFVSASQALPRIHKYPSVMEYVLEQKMQQDDNINPSARFEPQLEQGIAVQFADARDEQLARVFNMIFQFWEEHGYAPEELGSHTRNQNNSLIDAMNAIFGTQGLFDMCRNTDTHPVAQLAAVGKGLIEAAVRNLGFSLASGVMGGAAYILSEHIGAGLSAASGFFSTIAGIGLVIGFILYYIVPFMPFLYFFFAVGGWVKGLFEAMVGVPLWALAHLRIDGEGLPGSSGTYGYFLILEIFLRPFMIMMGLFASITIYSAMVKVLNDIFFLVVSNITGHDPVDRGACTITGSTGLFELGDEMYLRGAIDEFFFTIIYAVIVYMIGMSSFKLIDQIPNEIMRWIGANVKTFNDERAEPAKGLVQRITVGGGAMVGRLQQAASSGTSAVSSGAQGLIEGLRDR
ncbi:MAG: DotA/TraY family protein, partial [Pseudomonadota bacterium]